MNETPSILTSNYACGEPAWFIGNQVGNIGLGSVGVLETSENSIQRAFQEAQAQQFHRHFNPLTPPPEIMNDQKTPRRLVQVFIADTNENVPLEKCLLYSGQLKLTDLNDTELFFEIPINDLLKAHNEQRIKWSDKDASRKAGKDIFLDPVKIRELQMRVVNVAQF